MIKLKKREILFSLLLFYALCASIIFLAETFTILAMVLFLIMVRKDDIDSAQKKFFYFLVAAFIIRIITSMSSLNPSLSIKKIHEPFWFITFFPVYFFKREEEKMKLIRSLLIGMSVLTIYAIFMHIVIKEEHLFQNRMAPISGIMTYSSLCSMALILNVALLLKGRGHLIYFLTFIILFCGLLFTVGRSGWVGFSIGIFVFFLIKKPKYLIVLLLFFVSLFLISKGVRSGVYSIFDKTHPSNKLRLEAWRWGVRKFSSRPITGTGPNTIKFCKKTDTEGLSQITIDGMCHLHNAPLQFLATMGIFGIIMYLFYLYAFFSIPILSYKKTKSVISLGVLCAVISVTIVGFFECNLFDSEVTMLAGFMLGLTQKQ
jgi:O-antigen ligase